MDSNNTNSSSNNISLPNVSALSRSNSLYQSQGSANDSARLPAADSIERISALSMGNTYLPPPQFLSTPFLNQSFARQNSTIINPNALSYPATASAIGPGSLGGIGGSSGSSSFSNQESARMNASDVLLNIRSKLVVVGDVSVGKSAIISRVKENKFVSGMGKSTIGVAFNQLAVRTSEGHSVHFEIWDSAGEERFRAVNALYFKGAAVAIIVYDITRLTSFKAVPFWLSHVRRYGMESMITFLVANKIDLMNDPSMVQVTREMGLEYATQENLAYCETSAKSGEGIQSMFHAIARELVRLAPTILTDAQQNDGQSNAGFRVTQIRSSMERSDRIMVEKDNQETLSCCGV